MLRVVQCWLPSVFDPPCCRCHHYLRHRLLVPIAQSDLNHRIFSCAVSFFRRDLSTSILANVRTKVNRVRPGPCGRRRTLRRWFFSGRDYAWNQRVRNRVIADSSSRRRLGNSPSGKTTIITLTDFSFTSINPTQKCDRRVYSARGNGLRHCLFAFSYLGDLRKRSAKIGIFVHFV